MQPNLFDRVFKYPASQFVLPSENLTTEITAYFFQAWPDFRERFLRAIGVSHAEMEWTIETQRPLYDPGKVWDGKIPDLLIRSSDRRILIAVEVKIDAGVTYSDEAPQSRIYRDYLKNEQSNGRIQEGHLVLLTRWSPGALFVEGARSLRFSDYADWLVESLRESRSERYEVQFLGEQWLSFLRKQRWAMSEITELHIRSIKPMSELLVRLWDEVAAAREVALAESNGVWTVATKTKSTEHSLPTGNAIWDRGLTPAFEPKGLATLGYFYGNEGGEPIICPMLWFNSFLELDVRSPFRQHVLSYGSDGYFVKLPNIAPDLLQQPKPRDVWDKSREYLQDSLRHLKPISNATNTPGGTSSIVA